MDQPGPRDNGVVPPAVDMHGQPSDERLRGLLSAVISIAEELTLEAVLSRIVQSACQLLDAKYGALGVIGGSGGLSHFITEGIDPQLAKLIGPLPTGHGVLGLLIKDPRPIRLPNLHDHPASYGFPKHHPPMRTFLGVPIRIRDKVFGNLYLTEKNGGKFFTAEDQDLAVALAGAAGFAIENARLFDDAQLRTRWLEAGRSVAVLMMGVGAAGSGVGPGFVAQTALDASDSALALIASAPNEAGQVEVLAGAGNGSQEWIGRLLDLDSGSVQGVLSAGEPASFETVSKLLGPASGRLSGPSLLARLGTKGAEHGLLVLVREKGGAPYSSLTSELVSVYCAQSALALELAKTHQIREQLVLYTDRDRIAQDLHDVVIQRIFAVGLNVQSLGRFIPDSAGLARIRAITDELDATIKELRDTIYALRTSTGDTDLVSSRILNTVLKVSTPLSFAPRIVLSGPIDSRVPPEVAEQLLAVVTEGVSNAVRHAKAGEIDVAVTAGGGFVSVTVSDDGCGISTRSDRSGLVNMERRALKFNGIFQVESVAQGGTKFFWSVPLNNKHASQGV
ncbi:GAF domain-containing sensor histidine kinase [Arthrobacter silviterrae]|uniref:GAF domain-containing protein n=2 Tax=Arthrobacter TaxID=1663 RepID=A0ABX0DF76_9MICC|nr:GAF domain-containing sensor histidine kinase [Arthrobacter silviterrae]NGN85582.1 GAF domain-containing protein [Arthrobacter silviterrae]